MKTISIDRRRTSAGNYKPKKPPEAEKQYLPAQDEKTSAARALEILLNRRTEASMRTRLVLLDVGIPPHRVGFFNDAIDLGYRCPKALEKVTKTIYPVVAKMNGISPANVERAMRGALEKSCEKGKIENLNKLLHVTAFTNTDNICTKDFLYIIVDFLRMEYGPYSGNREENDVLNEFIFGERKQRVVS